MNSVFIPVRHVPHDARAGDGLLFQFLDILDFGFVLSLRDEVGRVAAVDCIPDTVRIETTVAEHLVDIDLPLESTTQP